MTNKPDDRSIPRRSVREGIVAHERLDFATDWQKAGRNRSMVSITTRRLRVDFWQMDFWTKRVTVDKQKGATLDLHTGWW